MWMARSAPFASASRMVWAARAGPAQSATTSPPCFSFNCSPASSAYASGSLISYERSASSIHFPEDAMRSWESRAGTCLIATTIFIETYWHDDTMNARPYSCSSGHHGYRIRLKIREPLVPPKPKLFDKRVLDLHGTRVIGHVIEIALRDRGFRS